MLFEEQKKQLDQLRKKDLKALSFLHQAVDESVFEKIAAAETSHEAWSILEKIYHGVTRIKNVKLQYLRMEFETLKMKSSETISEFFDRVTAIRNNMKALDENIEDKTIVQKILRSMTPKFEHVVCMLEDRANTEDMSIDELHGSLLVHEKRMNRYEQEEQVLQAKSPLQNQTTRGRGSIRGRNQRGRGRGNFDTNKGVDNFNRQTNMQNQGRGNNQGRGRARGRGHGQDQREVRNTNKSHIQCFNCKKYGHFSYECWSNPRKEEQVNYTEEKDDRSSETMLFICDIGENQGSSRCGP